MKLYDYDSHFFDFARGWMARHPGLTEDEAERSYNDMMREWLDTPADWLGGEKPGSYFDRFDDPGELMTLIREYDAQALALPEPLYRRVVSLGNACVPDLEAVVRDDGNPEALRSTAVALLRDIGAEVPIELYTDLVMRSEENGDLGELAGDALKAMGPEVVDALLQGFDDASDGAKRLILDICACFPGDPRICEKLVYMLMNRPEDRALNAALLGRLGDERAIGPLMDALRLSDLGYLDYIELRNAVEQLGGDPGEEREFHGDPDYEAMRGLE